MSYANNRGADQPVHPISAAHTIQYTVSCYRKLNFYRLKFRWWATGVDQYIWKQILVVYRQFKTVESFKLSRSIPHPAFAVLQNATHQFLWLIYCFRTTWCVRNTSIEIQSRSIEYAKRKLYHDLNNRTVLEMSQKRRAARMNSGHFVFCSCRS